MTLEELHLEKIPSVPQVLLELLKLCQQPVVEFDELAKVIEQEPSLSAKILQAVNNVFYRQWTEVTHIRRLLVVLGVDSVKQIAVTSAVHQFFSGFSANNETFVTSVWIRSLFCAHLAQDLARLTGHSSEDEAYLAGLLHRVGQLLLLENFPEKYQDILFMDDPDSLIEQVERKRFGYSYCDVGAALIRSWPVHPFMGDAVLFQNLPQDSVREGSALVKLLNLANRLSQSLVCGPAEMINVDDSLFGLNASLLTEVFNKAQTAVIDGSRAVGIDAEPYLNHVKPESITAELEVRRQAHQQLAVYVQNSALLGAAQFGKVVFSEKDALNRIRRDLTMVFGLQKLGFLLCSEDGRRLTGVVDDSNGPAISELSITLHDSASLAAQSLLAQSFQCSLQLADHVPVSILDQKLRHLFATDGVLFLPLLADDQPLGVVVCGVSRQRWQRLLKQRALLNLFAQQLARHLLLAVEQSRTLRQQLTEQRDQQRLAARKLVHEASNPLSIIHNYLHILGLKLGKDNAAADEIPIIKEEITRVGDILARMRDLDAPGAQEGEALQLNRLIQDLFRLFEPSLFQPRQIQVELDLDDNIPPLLLSSGSVKQVLMNLVKNAVEAMSAGGRLRVSTRDQVHKNGNLYVELQVCDTGPGLPDQVLSALFKPVVSTKKNHSGLGLSIVKNLLDRLSADVTCSSTATLGTRFQILLPRTVAESEGR